MSDTTKVTQIRAAYETKYAQAKESGRLDDPEIHQKLRKVCGTLAIPELFEWNSGSDNFEPGTFLDEWWHRYGDGQKARVPMRSWRVVF